MAAQWILAVCAVVALLWTTGSFSIALPTLSVLAAAAAMPKVVDGSWQRPAVQRLSRRTGALHGLVAPVAVGAVGLLHPEWLTGAHPLGAALAAGMLASAGGFVLTLCGLNATGQAWGSFEGPHGDRLEPEFQRPDRRR